MTEREQNALNNLAVVCKNFKGTLQEHEQLQQDLKFLAERLTQTSSAKHSEVLDAEVTDAPAMG